MIKGEGLENFGLEYRLSSGNYPVIGPYGVLTKGFVYNRSEEWSPNINVVSTSWTALIGTTTTSWTLYTGVTTTSWTLAF